MKYKLSICFLTIILIINSFGTVNIYAKDNKPENLYSLSCSLIDGETGRVLFEKDGNDKRAMASTTKIMTLILALEYGHMDEYVTVSSYASKMPDVQLGICEGEQYKLEDLYYSLMLESHNDVAVAIAEHIGGSVAGFSKMMNDKAKELGLSNTYFITPNGLDASDNNGIHSTTAVELSKIMKYCVMDSPMKDEFIKICQTKSYSFSDYSNSRSFIVNNKNSFLDMIDGVLAGKTGFTADAGYCYVAAVENNGRTLIIALLGCGWPGNKNYKWSDAKELFNYGFKEYNIKSVTNENTFLPGVEVHSGTPNDIISSYIKDYENVLLSENDEIELKYNIPKIIEAPIKKDEIIGSIDIFINDTIYKTINVYSKEYSYFKDFKYYLNTILDIFL